jgi:hypothetical protein
LELVGENPIRKRENVRGVRWRLFCGHHKMERITKCTERKKCNKNTERDNAETENNSKRNNTLARTVEYEHGTNRYK